MGLKEIQIIKEFFHFLKRTLIKCQKWRRRQGAILRLKSHSSETVKEKNPKDSIIGANSSFSVDGIDSRSKMEKEKTIGKPRSNSLSLSLLFKSERSSFFA